MPLESCRVRDVLKSAETGQLRTHAVRQIPPLFYHLVGSGGESPARTWSDTSTGKSRTLALGGGAIGHPNQPDSVHDRCRRDRGGIPASPEYLRVNIEVEDDRNPCYPRRGRARVGVDNWSATSSRQVHRSNPFPPERDIQIQGSHSTGAGE
jgi:hypothetical protein